MSENSNETANIAPSVEPAENHPSDQPLQQTSGQSCCKRGSSCKPHTSTIIALIALILAGYAAFTAASSHDNSAIETRLDNLASQIASANDQITTLDKAVKSNRENLIQTKLKKALQNIQEIGNLAGEGTKAAISEVENMLKTLTEISNQLTAPTPTETTPASIEPAAQPTIEPASKPETSAPAEITQPESTPPESTQAEPAAAEPTTTAPDSNAADQVPATTETTPTQPADASSVAPTDSQAPTATPPADTTPAAEPSAPQAF